MHNGKYTTEFKEVAVELARKLNNNTKAARDLSLKYSLNIQEKSLRDWRKEFKSEEDDKRIKKKQTRDIVCKYPEMEKLLMQWFLDRRRSRLAINYYDIKKKAKELNCDPNFTASTGWFRNFRRRYKISKRIPT